MVINSDNLLLNYLGNRVPDFISNELIKGLKPKSKYGHGKHKELIQVNTKYGVTWREQDVGSTEYDPQPKVSAKQGGEENKTKFLNQPAQQSKMKGENKKKPGDERKREQEARQNKFSQADKDKKSNLEKLEQQRIKLEKQQEKTKRLIEEERKKEKRKPFTENLEKQQKFLARDKSFSIKNEKPMYDFLDSKNVDKFKEDVQEQIIGQKVIYPHIMPKLFGGPDSGKPVRDKDGNTEMKIATISAFNLKHLLNTTNPDSNYYKRKDKGESYRNNYVKQHRCVTPELILDTINNPIAAIPTDKEGVGLVGELLTVIFHELPDGSLKINTSYSTDGEGDDYGNKRSFALAGEKDYLRNKSYVPSSEKFKEED